jgi:hypothetical protein
MKLTPSQRVNLIKEISRRLGNEGWSVVDLTLHQFGLPTSDNWNGTKEDYIVHLISKALDQNLELLGQHLGYYLDDTRSSTIDPSFWKQGTFRIFLSHLSSERLYVAGLQESLEKFPITAFVAHNDIEPTSEWQKEIESALLTADSLVALLHTGFHQSKWTDQELGIAMGRGLPIFTVQLGEVPYGFIGRFQAFSGQEKTIDILARELFDTYRKHKQTQKRMVEALVNFFEHSESFASSKIRIGYLEELQDWDVSYSERLTKAVETNRQIFDSFGVPERVTTLISKWKG